MKTRFIQKQVRLILFVSVAFLVVYSCMPSQETGNYVEEAVSNHNQRRGSLKQFYQHLSEYSDTQVFFRNLVPMMQYQDSMRIEFLELRPISRQDSLAFAGLSGFESNYMDLIKFDFAAIFGIYSVNKDSVPRTAVAQLDSIENVIKQRDIESINVFTKFVESADSILLNPIIE